MRRSKVAQERERTTARKYTNLFFRVWSAVKRGDGDESFSRLHRAPSPGGENPPKDSRFEPLNRSSRREETHFNTLHPGPTVRFSRRQMSLVTSTATLSTRSRRREEAEAAAAVQECPPPYVGVYKGEVHGEGWGEGGPPFLNHDE